MHSGGFPAGLASDTRRPWRPTLHELRAYNHLFSLTDHKDHGTVSKAALAALLRGTAVGGGCLDAIWQLSAGASADAVGRRGFYTAMKLVSLAQAGRAVATDGLSDPLPLPAIAGVDLDGTFGGAVNLASVRRTSSDSTATTVEAPAEACFIPQLLSPASIVSRLDDDDDDDDEDEDEDDEDETAAKDGGVDSVTDLLGRIDQMIGSPYSANTLCATQQPRPGAAAVAAKRGRLEETLAHMQAMCADESALNQTLAARVASEESALQAMCARVEAAQQTIADIAQQRAGLLARLQQVETQQQAVLARLQAAEAVAEQCSDEVGQLDAKVFAAERDTARMQRRLRQKLDNADRARSPPPPPSAWRNRLSSAFGRAPLLL